MFTIIAVIATFIAVIATAYVYYRNEEIARSAAAAKDSAEFQEKLATYRYKSDLGTYYRSLNDNSYGFMMKPEYADYRN